MKFKIVLFNISSIILLIFFQSPIRAEITMTEVAAEKFVRESKCTVEQTIEQALEKKIRRHSQRDLGWRVFFEDGKYDVEKAILVSKSMKMKYRWQIDEKGIITAVSKRAKKLCSEIF